MLTLKLYHNSGENIRVDKTDYLEDELSLTGLLKEETSVTSPSILIEKNDENILNYNYVFIQEFNRYYFIDDITSENNHLWRLSCSVDVLMSFKTEILHIQNPYVARNEYQYSTNIVDNELALYPNVDTIVLPISGSPFSELDGNSYCYVLTTITDQIL